jgi:hypothetical protein
MTTVLEQLGSLDLSGVVSGRASISSAVSGPDLQQLVASGIGPAALGSFGHDLQALQSVVSGDPAALLAPLGGLLEQVAGELHIDVTADGLLHATTEAVSLLSAVVAALSGDLSGLSAALGRELPNLVGDLAGRIPAGAAGAAADLTAFASLVAQLEAGAPADPAALADLVLQATLPFPVASLRTLRTQVDDLRSRCDGVVLPDTRTAGLHQAVAAVATAASGSDTAALQRALAMLEQVRAATISQLTRDLAQVSATVAGLDLNRFASGLPQLSAGLVSAERGILDLLAELREQLTAAKGRVEGADFAAIGTTVETMLGQIEAQAVAAIEPRIVEAISTAHDRLGGFLDGLGLRQARDEVLGAVHAVAAAIAAHDPTAPLAAVHGALDAVRRGLDPATLRAEIQQALQAIVAAAEAALQQVIDGLAAVRSGVQSLADEAEPPLATATDALESFASGVRDVQSALESLDIAKLGQSVASSLHGVTTTVQQVSSAVTLPDALRPQISSLADSIRSIDLQAAVEAPVAQALDGLQLPTDVTASLDQLVDTIRHLVPTELLASIQADVSGLLDQLTHLHPAIALGSLNDSLHGIARQVGQFKLADAVTVLEPAYSALRDALAALDPAVLLRPVIAAFDRLTSAISVPAAADVANRLGGAIDSAIDSAGGALTGSMSALPGVSTQASRASAGPGTPGGSSDAQPAGGPTALSAADAPDELPVRPGDAIRLLGHLPALLRDALTALDPPVVQACLTAVDDLTGGLAADLRALALAVRRIEDRVAATLQAMISDLAVPVAGAQLSVAAHLDVHAGGTVDVDATLLAVGRAGPAGLTGDLSAATGAGVAAIRAEALRLGGATGATLERVAAALDGCRLAGVTGDLQAFLAAIDPEPVAAALDDLVLSALNRGPDLVGAAGSVLTGAVERLRALLERYQPAAVAMRFLPLLQLIDDEIALLDPRALVAEVEDVYRLVVDAVAAYDPARIAASVDADVAAIVAEIASLDIATLVPDTSFLQPLADKVEAADPLPVLQGLATNLDGVAQRLTDVDLDRLIADVNGLGPKVSAAFDAAVEAVQREVLALLDALQFGGASGSASVSVGGSAGGVG